MTMENQLRAEIRSLRRLLHRLTQEVTPDVSPEVTPEVLLCNRIYISRHIAMDLTPEKMEEYLREIDVLCREENSEC